MNQYYILGEKIIKANTLRRAILKASTLCNKDKLKIYNTQSGMTTTWNVDRTLVLTNQDEITHYNSILSEITILPIDISNIITEYATAKYNTKVYS